MQTAAHLDALSDLEWVHRKAWASANASAIGWEQQKADNWVLLWGFEWVHR